MDDDRFDLPEDRNEVVLAATDRLQVDEATKADDVLLWMDLALNDALVIVDRLHGALEESIKLQSHYAGLLNSYDGGQRMTFDDTDAWLARLRDLRVLTELRGHLVRASEWAHSSDTSEDQNGWSCIGSTMDAVREGRVGLALERWNDLVGQNKPQLSSEADEWTKVCGTAKEDNDDSS